MENLIYPLTIVFDRYGGVYSEGSFTAWNEIFHRLPKEIDDSDIPCGDFWGEFEQGKLLNVFKEPLYVGVGETPQKALNDLMKLINKK